MPRITHPQFRSQLEPVKYPFSDYATLTNSTTDVIFEGTFLDASLYPVGNTGILYLSKVVVTRQKITIWVGSPDTEELAYGQFQIVDPPNEIKLVDVYGRPAGILISESIRLAVFQSWNQGVHRFTLGQTEFAATVITPRNEIGVRGFILPDGSVMTGEVWIVGDDGIVVSHETATEDGQELHAIRVDVVGDPLFRRRLCTATNLFQVPRFVKKLVVKHNCDKIDLYPDEDGNISLFAAGITAEQSVLRVRNTSAGVIIEAVGE